MAATTRADPSPSFRFHVEIDDVPVARFTECGGLSFEQTPVDYEEGGVNSHVHRFPARFKFANVTLKRGIATDGDKMWEWVTKAVQTSNLGQVSANKVTVILYDVGGHDPLRTWTFLGAFPIKWNVVALSAEQNAIAIETLEIAHQGMDFAQ